jgi:hypothetical protein
MYSKGNKLKIIIDHALTDVEYCGPEGDRHQVYDPESRGYYIVDLDTPKMKATATNRKITTNKPNDLKMGIMAKPKALKKTKALKKKSAKPKAAE